MTKELKCEFQKEIDNEKVCKAFEVNRYGDIICQEEDCQLCKLKAENEQLKHLREEIDDFISDISTCGFTYDDRCPDNLDELQCCIEDLCNKFSNYKQTLQEIKAIVGHEIKELTDSAVNGGRYLEILDLITKVEANQ